MSKHYIVTTIKVRGVPVAKFIVGEYKSYETAAGMANSVHIDDKIDACMDAISKLHFVCIEVVSGDRHIAYADSAERAL